jgi:hypothetical protein
MAIDHGDGTREVDLAIACRDDEATENEGWVSVRILVRDVQEFTIREKPNTTLQVLSEGLYIQKIDEGVGLEFGGALERPRTISLIDSPAFLSCFFQFTEADTS